MFTENLLALRRQRRLSQHALAKMAGISLVAYRNIETGISEPKAETLRALAAALGISMRELFVPNIPLHAVRFRALKKMKRRTQVLSDVKRWLNDFNDVENVLHDHRKFLLSDFGDQLARMNPGKERALYAAQKARAKLNLNPKEPVHDVCGLLEKAGIKVYPLAIESEGFFGLSVASDDGGPAIIVNVWDRISVERWIFSAAHELGHLLMHLGAFNVKLEEEDPQEEKEANWFASHFLMPDDAFDNEWGETRGLHWIERILKVKRIFHVSYKTVIYRLIEEHNYPETLWRDFNSDYPLVFGKRLLGNTEPWGLEDWDFVEDRLRRLVRKGIEEKAITMSRGAEILGIKLIKMRQIASAWGT